MAQAILTLIPNYMQVVVDNSANTMTFQWYNGSGWDDVMTLGLNGNTNLTVNNGSNTLNGNTTFDSGVQIPGTGGPHNASIDLTGNGSAAPYLDNNGNFHFPNAGGTSDVWEFIDGDGNQVINVAVGGEKFVKSLNNTLDDGSGNMAANPATTSLAGTTAGTIDWAQPERGTRKVFIAVASGYENDTTTAQTITFPAAFANTPAVSVNTTGLTVTATTTTLTITAPDSTTTYSGVIEVLGI
jgi:hypothetical protein